jgi:hypothetical protein
MLTSGFMSPLRNLQLKYLVRLKLEIDDTLTGDDFRFYSPKQRKDITDAFASSSKTMHGSGHDTAENDHDHDHFHEEEEETEEPMLEEAPRSSTKLQLKPKPRGPRPARGEQSRE